jgi:hypothetical protein
MAEALEAVHMRGRVLLRGWCWPVRPKLLFNQMAAPVKKSMDTTSHLWIFLYLDGGGSMLFLNVAERNPDYASHFRNYSSHRRDNLEHNRLGESSPRQPFERRSGDRQSPFGHCRVHTTSLFILGIVLCPSSSYVVAMPSSSCSSFSKREAINC